MSILPNDWWYIYPALGDKVLGAGHISETGQDVTGCDLQKETNLERHKDLVSDSERHLVQYKRSKYIIDGEEVCQECANVVKDYIKKKFPLVAEW